MSFLALSVQAYSQVNVQIFDNSADPERAVTNFWINDSKDGLDDFAFRDESPFLRLPAGFDINATVARAGAPLQMIR